MNKSTRHDIVRLSDASGVQFAPPICAIFWLLTEMYFWAHEDYEVNTSSRDSQRSIAIGEKGHGMGPGISGD